jgi:hypothetical protein
MYANLASWSQIFGLLSQAAPKVSMIPETTDLRFSAAKGTTMTTINTTTAICFAINEFGDGDHPTATPANLTYFAARYVEKCIARMARDHHVSEGGRAFAQSLTTEKIKHLIATAA